MRVLRSSGKAGPDHLFGASRQAGHLSKVNQTEAYRLHITTRDPRNFTRVYCTGVSEWPTFCILRGNGDSRLSETAVRQFIL